MGLFETMRAPIAEADGLGLPSPAGTYDDCCWAEGGGVSASSSRMVGGMGGFVWRGQPWAV